MRSVQEYEKAMKLLSKCKNTSETSRILKIPRTTLENWKLKKVSPPTVKRIKIDEFEILEELRNLIERSFTIPKISKILNVPYNTTLRVVKKYFKNEYYRSVKIKPHKLTSKEKLMTPELSYVIGVMFGDGYFAERSIRLGVIDRDFCDYFAENIKKWLNKKTSLLESIKRKRRYFICVLYSKDVRDFLFSIVREGYLPKQIISSQNEQILCSFIKGFSDSEGSVSEKYRIRLSNKNKNLLLEIKKILIKLGFNDDHLHIYSDRNDVYNLSITSLPNIRQFNEKIGFTIERKRIKLNRLVKI